MSSQHHWGYSAEDGPQKWPKLFGAGKFQSPINIQVGERLRLTCCAGQPLASQQQLKQGRHHLDSQGEEAHRRSPSANSRASTDTSTDSELFERRTGSAGSFSASLDSDLGSSPCSPSPVAPLDKQHQQTRFVVSKRKLFLGYPRYLHSMQLCNTGHGWQVDLPAELAEHTLLAGPPLADREYRLLQFHCHWGSDCEHGSEHQINGQSFSAELHFVHWNCTDFSSPAEAAKHKHGLVVLAVLVQALEGEHNRNKHLDKIAQAIDQVQRPETKVAIKARLDIKKLFPADRWNYATYEGSLTTPPLSEVVDWLVFLQPIQCSTAQIDQFRKLRCLSERQPKLVSNCRPVQPTNGRLVTVWSHH